MLVAIHTRLWQPADVPDQQFAMDERLTCSVYHGTDLFFSLKVQDAQSFSYCSRRPIRRDSSGSMGFITDINDHDAILSNAVNNIVGIHVRSEGLVGYSAHAIRGRFYYLNLKGKGLLMSDDLRKLLPFSSHTLDPDACISMLKFGSVPERVTVVRGIRTIPVAQVARVSCNAIYSLISEGGTLDSYCTYYHRLRFPLDGGDLSGLRNLLDSTFSFIAGLNPWVPMSGGIDSTLMARLIDRHSDNVFPAYFIRFGENDPEVSFARQAASGTKADLVEVTLLPEMMGESIHLQGSQLIEPVGETSPLATASFFANMTLSGRCIIDGTMADGCFGTTVYTRSPFAGHPYRPRWQQELNERIAAFLIWNRLPGRDRFFPRDSAVDDRHIQLMNMYLGPFGNTWIRGAKQASRALLPLWKEYFDLLDARDKEPDEWMRIIAVKMTNYAGRTQASKSFDGPMPYNCTLYPFSWRSTLEIQGHFSWQEKSEGNIQKAILKKLLAEMMPKEFVYRKKVGLNSDFQSWAQLSDNRIAISNLTERAGGVAEFLLGKSRLKKLISEFSKRELDTFTTQLIISLAMLQAWSDHNKVRFT